MVGYNFICNLLFIFEKMIMNKAQYYLTIAIGVIALLWGIIFPDTFWEYGHYLPMIWIVGMIGFKFFP